MLAKWIINHQRPFTIIEDSELVEAFQLCHPDANLGKRDAMKKQIMKLYEDGREELKVYIFWGLFII
jgi:hypothetical protein